MLRMSDARIDGFIAEDVPYVDLTCAVLGIGEEPGEMEYYTREGCVLAGGEAARRVAEKLGCTVMSCVPDGERVSAGETFMVVRGRALDLHAAWKVCLNLFDHLSAVATKTRAMVDAAHAENPHCEVLTTRKSMPGAKDLLTSAVMAGGAFPHRLGLSETILVFDHHLTFFGGFDAFVEQLPHIKGRCIEKKLFVEADAEHARAGPRRRGRHPVRQGAGGRACAARSGAARHRPPSDAHCGGRGEPGQRGGVCCLRGGRPCNHGPLCRQAARYERAHARALRGSAA